MIGNTCKRIPSVRRLSSLAKPSEAEPIGVPSFTRALEMTNYAEWGKFEMNYNRPCPEIRKATQILVRNLASSINKHDSEMRVGYLQNFLDWKRRLSGLPAEGFELPLVLGRDFAGVVMDVGKDVHLFKPGDEVFGSVSVLGQGCFSDFIVVDEHLARLKPSCLSFIEAASLPYVCGALLSVCNQPNKPSLFYTKMTGKRVLIHGAGGGLGTLAVQLLKSGGAHVSTTSLARSCKLLQGLGADSTFLFRAKDFEADLEMAPKFDVVLDVTGESAELLIPRVKKGGNYVSFKQRLFENLTDFDPDLYFGFQKDVLKTKMMCYLNHRCWYSFFSYQDPYRFYLDHIIELVENETLVPVVQNVVCLEDVPETMKRLEKEHAQGKTVVDMLLAPGEAQRLQAGSGKETIEELPAGGS